LDCDGNVLVQKEITSKSKKDPQRFIDLAREVYFHLFDDDKVAIEGFSYGSKGKGVSTQYGIGWIIRTKLINHDYKDIPPSVLKKFATGKGNVKKENMILPIYQKWGFESDSDNIRDAYVLARISMALDGIGTLTKYQEEVIEKIKH
jgi:crossover junction endodeoxyribonuclease RuvC